MPTGTGLSSSASIEIATAFALNDYLSLGYDKLELVKMAKRVENDFIGLNTPSGAIFILGIYCNFYFDFLKIPMLYNSATLIIIAFMLAFLLVAEFRMFSLKGNPFSWQQNKFRVLLLVFAIPQLIFLKWLGLSTVIISYIILDNKFRNFCFVFAQALRY